ncbi:MAG: amino acid permease [Micromonosporaceae bacterium]|nr:amino acid permease [Micromonosporaceae bacterium]
MVKASAVSEALAADRLGVPAVVFFVMSAATPLTVVAGVITLAYAITGSLSLPLAFVLVGAVLAVFAVGYVAMSRHVANAGAFYAYISQGLGRPAGVGAAWVALTAYNLLQVGLYGVIGFVANELIAIWFAVSVPWWVVAFVAWAIVAGLGVQQVDVNGRVLAVLLCAEVAVIAVFSAVSVANPDGDSVSFTTLAPGNIVAEGVGAILVLGVLGFVGFEAATVFSEEAKNPRRTVPAAMYVAVGLLATLYATAAWAMSVAVGPENIAAMAREMEVALIFVLAEQHLGAAVANIGWVLFLTSLLAAMIAFHNITARYMFSLGRERVLPAALGRTSVRTGAPKIASLVQTVIGALVITGYAVGGFDPLVQLFFWGGAAGGLGVLLLITATSAAVLGYFARRPSGETLWRRAVAPSAATVALVAVAYLALLHFAAVLGVGSGHPLRWGVPAAYLLIAVAGVGWGLVLRRSEPGVYASIGRGAKSVTRPPAAEQVANRPAPSAPELPR